MAPEAAVREAVLVRLGDGLYAIGLHDIREIIPWRRATRLPGAPPCVRGLLNVRGTIVTVLDLGARLRGTAVPETGSVVLVEHGAKLVGVAVDGVTVVHRFRAGEVEPPGPEHAEAGVVTGLGHSGGSIVILVDVHAIIQQVLL